MSTGSKTTSTTTLPSYITDAGKNILSTASSLASNPYPTYTGELVAPQNSQETTGENDEYNNANNFTSGLSNSTSAANSLTNYLESNGVPSLSNIMSYADNGNSSTYANDEANLMKNMTGGSGTWNTQTAQQYMSPYEQTALNSQLGTMKQTLAQQQNTVDGEATQANAFGDARHAVASTLANQNADLQMANVESTGMNDAYNTGLSAFNQTYQNALSGLQGAATTNQNQESTNLSGVNAGLTAQGTQTNDYTSLINSLLNNTTTGQNLYNTAGQTEYSAGEASQNQQQNVDNANYQQFLNAQNYPYEMLQLEESALGSVPYGTTTTNTQKSSALGNILGLASTGIGAAGEIFG